MRNQTKRVATLGMMFALMSVLSFLEGTLVPLLGLPPGVKLGLANIVVMYALFFLGGKSAITLAVLKGMFSFLTRGVTAGVLSLTGGILSVLFMLLLKKHWYGVTNFILSVCGAVMHNCGQLLAIRLFLMQSTYTIYYLPILLISGLVMGGITSVTLNTLLPALEKLNLIEK